MHSTLLSKKQYHSKSFSQHSVNIEPDDSINVREKYFDLSSKLSCQIVYEKNPPRPDLPQFDNQLEGNAFIQKMMLDLTRKSRNVDRYRRAKSILHSLEILEKSQKSQNRIVDSGKEQSNCLSEFFVLINPFSCN